MGERHIVAMAGGGFSDDDPVLDDFILDLTGKERPRVCFVPTASGDAAAYVERFYAAFTRRSCEPTHLSLFQLPYPAIGEVLSSHDVVYVGGGSTANMMTIWRLHGLDETLRHAWERGVVLAGISAGAMCWFGSGVTDSLSPELAPWRDGLGLLEGSFCPHFANEPDRRPAYHRLVREHRLPAGYAADDFVALHFTGSELSEVVASRPNVAAYRVDADGEAVREERLEPRPLVPT